MGHIHNGVDDHTDGILPFALPVYAPLPDFGIQLIFDILPLAIGQVCWLHQPVVLRVETQNYD